MLRRAKVEDIPVLRQMGEEFLSYLNAPFPTNLDKAMKFLENAIREETVVFLVSDVDGINGVICFVVCDSFLGTLVGQELFWWVNTEARKTGVGKELLVEAELIAMEMGAKAFGMIDIKDDMAEYYGRMGYRFSERTYWKGI